MRKMNEIIASTCDYACQYETHYIQAETKEDLTELLCLIRVTGRVHAQSAWDILKEDEAWEILYL